MKRLNAVVISFACLFVAGCIDDGSDDEGSTTTSGDFPQGSTTVSNTNGGLQGYLWLERDSEIFNLDSGRTTVVGTNDGARPRDDGREFATLHKSVRFADDPLCRGREFTSFDRVSIHDTVTGLAVAGFEVQEDIYGAPKLSPDGQTIAAHWDEDSVCTADEVNLTVWSRDGEQLIQGVEGIGDFDWLPDNRLIFEINGDIAVEAERNTFRYDTIANLGNIPGTPREFDVSPDGDSVIFEMVTDASGFLVTVDFRDATVWRINIDGTGLEQIITSSDANDEPRINAPIFSPDGDELIVTEGWLSGGAVSFTGFETSEFPIITGSEFVPIASGPVTQVVPLDALSVALPPPSYSAQNVRPIFSRDDDGSLEPARLWPLEGRRWTETITPRAAQPGSLPGVNGRVNRGLTGSLYRIRDDDGVSELQRLDLSTGALSAVPVPDAVDLGDAESFAVSDDESHFAIMTYSSFEFFLWTFDANGQNLNSFDLTSSAFPFKPESPPRFGPNSNSLIAWVYEDDDFEQSLVILDINSSGSVPVANLGYVDDFDWFPNGDLLIVDGANLSRVLLENGTFVSSPIAELHTRIDGIDIHPDGQSLVYSGNRQLVSLNLQDDTRQRLTAWTDTAELVPSYSPDGQYITFKKLDREDVPFGWPWIVASDAADVRVFDVNNTVGAMRVGEGTNLDWRITRSDVIWR